MQSPTMIRSLARLALPLALCLRAAAIAPQTPAPAPTPTPTPTSSFAQVEFSFLFKRQDCPAGTYQCSEPGFDDVCCANNQVCARDESNSPACCPAGYDDLTLILTHHACSSHGNKTRKLTHSSQRRMHGNRPGLARYGAHRRGLLRA